MEFCTFSKTWPVESKKNILGMYAPSSFLKKIFNFSTKETLQKFVKLIKFMKYYALNNIMLGFEKLSGHRLIQQTNITSNSILSNEQF